MIGKKLKGFKHLTRLAKASNEIIFFYKRDFFVVEQGIAIYVPADVVKNPYMASKSDYLLLFNDSFSNVIFATSNFKGTLYEKISVAFDKKQHVWVLPVDKTNINEEISLFTEKIYVPEDFEKKYAEFCSANKKQMPNATKYCEANDSILKYLYAISNGSKNFFFWAVNVFYKQKISIYVIEKILSWNDKYNQLSKFLKKGTITGYTNRNDVFSLIREMAELRREKRANDTINMFNTAQKKVLKEANLTKRDFDTLSKFCKLSGKKKNNFIRKVSTITDPNEILRQMSFLADVHFEWKKESLLDFIKNTENFNCEVVIDRDDILLLKVKDYETVKRIAKTTNWCISKDKKYWNEYVEKNPMATQYVLLDFSRKEDDNLSIIGFTSVHDKGITNAHDFQNKNLIKETRIDNLSEIKSFVSKFVDSNSIYGVLDKYGISMSDVVSYNKSQYEWNRESMFNYLNQCVDEDDYYIIADYGNKVALICDNCDIMYLLGDNYVEQRKHGRISGEQHIVFADFTKKGNDPDRLIFGVINHNFESHESNCGRLYNCRFEAISKSFDSKLEEFGLPYDIICRKDDSVKRFYSSFQSFEMSSLKELIKDKKVINSLKKQEKRNSVRDYIRYVTLSYSSPDYLNLIYDNGLTLSDVIGDSGASEIASSIILNLYDSAANNFKGNMFVPDKSVIDLFNDEKIKKYHEAYYVGNFLMLIKIINKEVDNAFMLRITRFIAERNLANDLVDLIETILFYKAVDNYAVHNYAVLKNIVAYAYNKLRYRVITVIQSNKNKAINELLRFFNTSRVAKTTEMWVSHENGIYTVEKIDEIASHVPKLNN